MTRGPGVFVLSQPRQQKQTRPQAVERPGKPTSQSPWAKQDAIKACEVGFFVKPPHRPTGAGISNSKAASLQDAGVGHSSDHASGIVSPVNRSWSSGRTVVQNVQMIWPVAGIIESSRIGPTFAIHRDRCPNEAGSPVRGRTNARWWRNSCSSLPFVRVSGNGPLLNR